MDGDWLKRLVRGYLGEDANTDFISDFDCYNYLWEAACEFAKRTKCLRSTQSITTVADQAEYTLNADFMEIWTKNDDNALFVKFSDGTTDSFIKDGDYFDIIYDDNDDSVAVPDRFAVSDVSTLGGRITGTATSAGALSAGETQLNVSGGGLSSASVGDMIHNITDGSRGIVLEATSDIALKTALFDGSENDWDQSDAFVIIPQGRMKLVLDPPPSASGNTVTVYYVQRPAPVFSSYGIYRFPSEYSAALAKYAAWLFKYRDHDPNFGDKWYVYWDQQVRRLGAQLNKSFNNKDFKVSFKKR